MYATILSKVTAVINETANAASPRRTRPETYQSVYDYLFDPKERARQDRAEKIENLRQKAVLGVTAAAVVGEAIHLAKRSNVGRFFKK